MTIKQRLHINKVIDKGAPVSEDREKEREWINFCLRMSKEMSNQIDDAMKETVGLSKTGWILQAIHKQLKKE